MEPSDLLKYLDDTFDALGVPYLVVGSMATIGYGEPRLTNDIDVFVSLTLSQVPALCAAFQSPEYYLSADAVEQAVRQGFQFNILHPASGLKVDVIIATESEFDRSQLARSVQMVAAPGIEATFASPEDVIIKKLEYFKEGKSEKHLRDIVGVLKVRGDRIDRVYLNHWIGRFGLETEWALIEGRLKEGPK